MINNSKYRKFDASRLCVGMESNILDVKFKNPQMVKSMEDMFNGCIELADVDINNIKANNK